MADQRSGGLNRRSLSRDSARFGRGRPARPISPTGVGQRVGARRQQAVPIAVDPQVVTLPQPKPMPPWLSILVKVQQGSSILTVLLVASVLIVYGWTVYVQQSWGQAYRRLESLQKQERQLTATNEVLKNQMAQQAEDPKAGLVLPDPSNTIFLSPAPQRPAVQPKTDSPGLDSIPTKPLGY
jgi:hypothetical protein